MGSRPGIQYPRALSMTPDPARGFAVAFQVRKQTQRDRDMVSRPVRRSRLPFLAARYPEVRGCPRGPRSDLFSGNPCDLGKDDRGDRGVVTTDTQRPQLPQEPLQVAMAAFRVPDSSSSRARTPRCCKCKAASPTRARASSLAANAPAQSPVTLASSVRTGEPRPGSRETSTALRARTWRAHAPGLFDFAAAARRGSIGSAR